MKAFTLVIFLVLTCSYATAGEFLTKTEKQKILKTVDLICGDTWCEGDNNFSFRSLTCQSETQSCLISFRYGEWTDEDAPYSERFPSRASCEIKGVSKYSDFLNKDEELSDGIYDQLNACITELGL